MGACESCKKKSFDSPTEDLKIDEYPIDKPDGRNTSNESSPRIFHNTSNPSIEIKVKLAIDRGNIKTIPKTTASPIHSQSNSLRDAQSGKAVTEKPANTPNTSQEKPEESLEVVQGDKNQKRHSIAIQFASNMFQALKPHIQTVLEKNKAEKKEVVKELPKIAIDPSKLVLESKKSISDTYQMLGLLGKGAFGEVSKVRHRINGKLYALKMISKSSCEEISNLLNEVEILKTLVFLLIFTLR